MKVILRNYGIRMTNEQKQVARAQASDMTRTRSTAQVPSPPRDLILQAAPRGILVSWSLPAGFNTDIAKWRVYKDTESNLYQEMADRGTRQCFVETSAGATPPVTNIFVSSINLLGYESQKVQAQGQAAVEAGAPPMPPSPPPTGSPFGGYTGGCVEEGTPVIEPEGSTQELEENSDWVSLQIGEHDPVLMHPETLVVVYKRACDLQEEDRISVGTEGAWAKNWVAGRVYKDSKKVVRRCPGGRYHAGTAQIELHNLKKFSPL